MASLKEKLAKQNLLEMASLKEKLAKQNLLEMASLKEAGKTKAFMNAITIIQLSN
jgi:hypothetical protein